MGHTARCPSVRARTFVHQTPISHPTSLTPHHRRFHTRFYVAFLPTLSASSFSSGVTQHRLPTSDGGQEVIEARFVHPHDALAEHRAKKIGLMPPQHYIISTISDILFGPEARIHQRERVERLSAGAFGRMVVHVRAGKKDASGRTPLVFRRR
jgi:hypothetical protein